jgi:tetratricopeptide (TPR) repeat protein
MGKDELLERYEALGEEDDFLAAKPLFEQDLREQDLHGQPGALLLRQYGYLLECHGRYAIRRAIEQYERAIALDPAADKVRYQWMSAKAAVREADHAIALYTERVAASPGDVRERRFLSAACLLADDYDRAAEVIGAGLGLAPDDRNLIYDRGEVKAATGDPEGALADWRRALELDPADLSPVYASAFLLEREGRLAEAAESWRYIVEYCDTRGWDLTAAWPRQELQRLHGLLAGHHDPGR